MLCCILHCVLYPPVCQSQPSGTRGKSRRGQREQRKTEEGCGRTGRQRLTSAAPSTSCQAGRWAGSTPRLSSAPGMPASSCCGLTPFPAVPSSPSGCPVSTPCPLVPFWRPCKYTLSIAALYVHPVYCCPVSTLCPAVPSSPSGGPVSTPCLLLPCKYTLPTAAL